MKTRLCRQRQCRQNNGNTVQDHGSGQAKAATVWLPTDSKAAAIAVGETAILLHPSSPLLKNLLKGEWGAAK